MNAGFLEEDNGNRSTMRLMSVLALFAAVAFGVMTITRSDVNKDDTGIYVTFGFLISAFAPKALQKFAEQKLPTFVPNHPEMTMQRSLPVNSSNSSVVDTREEMIRRMQERGR